ncbi:arylsulfatase F-like [Suncus etruscus]|uniref:arylsulfatase F-like n=1 Tax=Suncus etruscus TaxID=109475 RepID=UPI00210F9FCD|nr:arylsulfatase F-like [Suncus etruscus]
MSRDGVDFQKAIWRQALRVLALRKWHLGLNCHGRDDHCHHPSHYGFESFYGMPYTLVDTCWPNPTRDTQLALFVQHLIALTVLSFVLGKVLRVVSTSWFFLLYLGALLFLLSYFWSSSHTSSLYWDCVLMRGHDITEQPMKAERAASIMIEEATSFLERNQEGPFLLLFSFLHVHTPLPTSDAFIGTSRHGLYGDNVQEMDFMVGQLLNALDRLSLTNKTLVYFASDHGGHQEARRGHAQHGGWNGVFKGGKAISGWEGGIRVPGIVRWPGQLPPETVVDEPTSLMDILPTLAILAGGTLPQDRQIDGHDLMPLLRGEQMVSEHESLFHYCERDIHAVRWRPRNGLALWKVHFVTPNFEPPGAQGCYVSRFCSCLPGQVTAHDPPLLFDLSRDPSESRPLSRDTEPQFDEVIRRVSEAVREHRAALVSTPVQLTHRNKINPRLRPCCGVFPYCMCDREGLGDTQLHPQGTEGGLRGHSIPA